MPVNPGDTLARNALNSNGSAARWYDGNGRGPTSDMSPLITFHI